MTKDNIIANSPQCIKSELDLFYVPPTNTSIESGGWGVYHPVSIIDHNDGPLEFYIPATENDYIHLSKTLLYLQVDFQKINTVIATTDNFSPVNNFASSLFSQIDVSLKNESIETSNSTYAYKAYITDQLNFGEDAKTSVMQSNLFYKDTAGEMESTEIDSTKAHNHGYVERRSVVMEGSGSIELLT